MNTNFSQPNPAAQPRFRDRIADSDRRVLYALIMEFYEKDPTADAVGVCRAVAHELGTRRDQARARDDEPASIRWAGLLNVIAEDSTGFRKHVESILHWSGMTDEEKRAAIQPTPGQMALLDKLGHRGIVKDKREASAIIDRLKAGRG